MEQMKITIKQDDCNRCGHCGGWFRGLPELAFSEDMPVPHWIVQDQDIMADLRQMINHCDAGAIGLIACEVY